MVVNPGRCACPSKKPKSSETLQKRIKTTTCRKPKKY